jgi:hypothetical protein
MVMKQKILSLDGYFTCVDVKKPWDSINKYRTLK